MILVAFGAIGCMIASFVKGDFVVGILAALTVLIPVIIWFSDDNENKQRDEIINEHTNSLTWHGAEINKKADAEQGVY